MMDKIMEKEEGEKLVRRKTVGKLQTMSIPKLKEEINLDMNNFLNGTLDKVIQNFTNLRARTGGDAVVNYTCSGYDARADALDKEFITVTYNPSGTRR
jgi:hypothetical protein